MQLEKARQRLANALRTASFFSTDEIHEWERKPVLPETWIWDAIVEAFATWGSARGAEALDDPAVAAAISYNAVAAVPEHNRVEYLARTFEDAKFRYPNNKAEYAAENFSRIERIGGAVVATDEARSLVGYEAKLRYVTQFKGIGAKYGRNIWMTARDSDFMRSIAVDLRLRNVAAALSVDVDSFEELEAFFVSVADDLGVSPWGLDRLLYRKNREVLALLGRSAIVAQPNVQSVWVVTSEGKPIAAFTSKESAEQLTGKLLRAACSRVDVDPET